ncbi:MAG: hypothetical protein NZO58_11530, partial [Gemmataceae bacterium]|nr:hypothetical protein [Gemmataceae bacterium]
MEARSHARVFHWLRWRLTYNGIVILLRGALLKAVTIIVCSFIIGGLLFVGAYLGFRELKTRWEVPLDQEIIKLLFSLMFFSLTILLIFSTGII